MESNKHDVLREDKDMSNEVKLNFNSNYKLPMLDEESKYSSALNDLSVMANKLEEKNRIIETLAWKVDVLSKVIAKAGIDIDNSLSIDEVAQYPLREEAE